MSGRSKRLIMAVVVMGLLSMTTPAPASGPIKPVVNDREIKPDVPPQLIKGRVMVPVRWVAEALGARVEWEPENNQVRVTPLTGPQGAAAREELELLSLGLREVAGPRELVEKYAQALKSRNGALARAYLAPELKEQVLPGVIGVSTPITAVEIEEKGAYGASRSFLLRAYFGPYGDRAPVLAFSQVVTVAPENGGRYLIVDVIALEDNTNGAFWEQPGEVLAALPEGARVLRWVRVDADGDGGQDGIYLVYGNGETGRYALWRAGRLYPLGGEVALGNQLFTPPLVESVRDINDDGRPEIVWSDWGADAGEMKLYVWSDRGPVVLFEAGANRIELVDLDGDGRLEIAVGNRPRSLAEPVFKLYRWQDGKYVEQPGTFREEGGRYLPLEGAAD
ncbi:MAG: stalk domain-containing protein [Moorellales bacterium]